MSRTQTLLSAGIVAAGGALSPALADVPRVAVDIAPVHSLVARVMDGVGTPDLVIPAGASPHEYNLRPSEAEALQEADLVFWMGGDLTPWLEGAIDTLASGAEVSALLEADGIALLDLREDASFETHDHDHGDDRDHDRGDSGGHDDHAATDAADAGHGHEGDDHAQGDHAHAADDDHGDRAADEGDHGHDHAGHDHGAHDPHAWLSPDNAATWMNVVAADLSAADPGNAGAYFANAAAGIAEIEALKGEIDATLAPVRDLRFVVFHDAYQYFEDAFDMPASGAISVGDATDPSPARVAEIQDRVREEGIDCVLAEPQYNPAMVATILDGTEASTGVLDPLGSDLEPGPALYPELLRNLAGALASCR